MALATDVKNPLEQKPFNCLQKLYGLFPKEQLLNNSFQNNKTQIRNPKLIYLPTFPMR